MDEAAQDRRIWRRAVELTYGRLMALVTDKQESFIYTQTLEFVWGDCYSLIT